MKLLLPKNHVGDVFFNFNYDVTNFIDNSWVNLRKNAIICPINVIPNDSYNIFVSRGLSNEDRLIGDHIVNILQKWNINTITVGIEVKVPEGGQIAFSVKKEIENAEALIAIATPRFVDNVTNLWKAMEWYHGEVGIAFGIDKPLLIIKDERVSLGGLPSYLTDEIKVPAIEFNHYNLRDFRLKINQIMPSFREAIKSRKMNNFLKDVGKIGLYGLAAYGGLKLVKNFYNVQNEEDSVE